jgi:hypothetical protein
VSTLRFHPTKGSSHLLSKKLCKGSGQLVQSFFVVGAYCTQLRDDTRNAVSACKPWSHIPATEADVACLDGPPAATCHIVQLGEAPRAGGLLRRRLCVARLLCRIPPWKRHSEFNQSNEEACIGRDFQQNLVIVFTVAPTEAKLDGGEPVCQCPGCTLEN